MSSNPSRPTTEECRPQVEARRHEIMLSLTHEQISKFIAGVVTRKLRRGAGLEAAREANDLVLEFSADLLAMQEIVQGRAKTPADEMTVALLDAYDSLQARTATLKR